MAGRSFSPAAPSATPPPPRVRNRRSSLARRRSPFLLLAAALVAALGVWLAHDVEPAAADSLNFSAIWSTNLTVREDAGQTFLGCNTGNSAGRCSDSAVLADNSFTDKGLTYVVDALAQSQDNQSLEIVFEQAIPDEWFYIYTLRVDGVSLPFGAGRSFNVVNPGDMLGWRWLSDSHSLRLTAGQQVRVELGRLADIGCLSDAANQRTSFNPTDMRLFAGNTLLTAAWINPPTDKPYVEYLIRWREATNSVWLNANGATGDLMVGAPLQTQDIAGLDNDVAYRVEVRLLAYDDSRTFSGRWTTDGRPRFNECFYSGWVGATGTPTAGSGAYPARFTVSTSSAPLREGGSAMNVYFTLDQPAQARVSATVGSSEEDARVPHNLPAFAPGARTAVMSVGGVPQDSVDNNCRTLVYDVWFNAPSLAFGGHDHRWLPLTVKDDDGAADPCEGRLNEPLQLSLELAGVDGDADFMIVSVTARLDRRPGYAVRVTVDSDASGTASRSRSFDGTDDFFMTNTGLTIGAGDVTSSWTATLNVYAGAGDNETIVLTAAAEQPAVSTPPPLTLTVGNLRQRLQQGSPGEISIIPESGDSQPLQVNSEHGPLIAQMLEWRNDPQWSMHKAHTDRWDRALLAFGETVADTSLTPMTADEAQAFADRGWERWVNVALALEQIEGFRAILELVGNGGPPFNEGLPDNAEPGNNPPPANQAPSVASALWDATITSERGTKQVSLAGVFADADGDSLSVSARSSNQAVATVSAAADGSSLTLTAQARGTATITVTAADGNGGSVSDTFTVTVKAAPVVASALSDLDGLAEGDSRDVSLSGVFRDADGDALTLTTDTSNEAVANAFAFQETLTIVAVAAGTATITVTAEDADGNRVSDTFELTVAAPEPEPQAPASSDVVARYDADGDGAINVKEYIQALRDRAAGRLTDAEWEQLLNAYLAFAYG